MSAMLYVRCQMGFASATYTVQWLLIVQDILLNRSIKDALIAEEKFFRSRPVRP